MCFSALCCARDKDLASRVILSGSKKVIKIQWHCVGLFRKRVLGAVFLDFSINKVSKILQNFDYLGAKDNPCLIKSA
jgi:hypothetical protein